MSEAGRSPMWCLAFSDASGLSYLARSLRRRGCSSLVGGHPRDGLEEQDVYRSVACFGRAADFEEVSTRYGVSLDSRGSRRTSLRASSPKAIEVEECVGAIRRLPAA